MFCDVFLMVHLLVLRPIGSAENLIDIRGGTITSIGGIIVVPSKVTSIEYSDILVATTGKP